MGRINLGFNYLSCEDECSLLPGLHQSATESRTDKMGGDHSVYYNGTFLLLAGLAVCIVGFLVSSHQ